MSLEDKIAKQKARYLELLDQLRDKKKAADEVGIDLVILRDWRHHDRAFNRAYKNLTVGGVKAQSRDDLKEPFLQLIKDGKSQRKAAEELNVSIITVRTWKKTDDEFKRAINSNRKKKGKFEDWDDE